MTARDRHAHISCPRQRALARRIADVCDLFSCRFAELEPGVRLLDVGRRRGGVAGPVREATRMFAVGAVYWLGKELGLPNHDLHGHGQGRTEIDELRGVHYTTLYMGQSAYEALRVDAGEFGRLAVARMNVLRASAIDEVVRTKFDVNSATGDWLRQSGWYWTGRRWVAPGERIDRPM